MSEERNTIAFTGCSPTPIAGYLKALGVFRVLSEQADPDAVARWQHNRFVIDTRLGEPEIRDFFLDRYAPSPIIAPWNGGSGFSVLERKQNAALSALRDSSAARFAPYSAAIRVAEQVRRLIGVPDDGKVDGTQKRDVLELCRSLLADDALQWLDAVVVLTDTDPKYPPLLGTGGNDGRLEFTTNYIQRLAELIAPDTGAPTGTAAATLDDALFGRFATGRASAPFGQFNPGAAGGPNQTTGFDGNAAVNAWDFVLALEGALMFAAASTRRLGRQEPGTLAYPFSVRQSGVDYGSAATIDESKSRAEIWLPLWARASRLGELSALFAEGRADIGRRSARNGVDFARAIASLGVASGIAAFERYGFQERNGLAYFATPLGQFRVAARPEGEALLGPLDGWIERYTRAANDENAPAAAVRASRHLQATMVDLSRAPTPDAVGQTFIALGRCERVATRSERWREDKRIRPLFQLDQDWVRRAPQSAELRLACALAAVVAGGAARGDNDGPLALRTQLQPVRTNDRAAWWADDVAHGVVWSAGDVVSDLLDVLRRRCLGYRMIGSTTYADATTVPAHLADVEAFVAGKLDDRLLVDYLHAAVTVDWRRLTAPLWTVDPEAESQPDALYAMLKACFPGHGTAAKNSERPPVRLDPTILQLAAMGDAIRASERAARRLRSSGRVPRLNAVGRDVHVTRRCAAAVLFPIAPFALERLVQSVAPTQDVENAPLSQSPQPAG